ncbi:hypothetical protein F66182_2844 [Fusarium sp. NRRL 66182]|nr:hypothetical protein F66182_2844 [Fusarium sp. NRRL 66182]
MSIRRSATRRGPPGVVAAVPRPKKGYENVKQGLQQLYPELDSGRKTDMDIVFVPGLGAHPLGSFKSTRGDFNWASDKEGICRDFPNARILLYHCESSWTGSIKVKQFLGNLAQTLLDGLKSKREDLVFPRPITFIGHSMGGLVIAKAICIAATRQDLFPGMFEDIAGSAFFGTPFHGAEAASMACMLSTVGEKLGQTTASKLLELMRPDDESLNELRKEFIRLVIKTTPKIELCGFWEEHPTTIKDLSGMPEFLTMLNIPIPKRYADFVTRESAILDGVMETMGLAANHRDLVKFDSSKDERYSLVRSPLKRLINGSHLRVKNRHNATRHVDQTSVNAALRTLEGAQVRNKRDSIAQSTTVSPWFSQEPEFLSWLAKPDDAKDGPVIKRGDCLWVRGRDGRGKTSAALSSVQEIEDMINADEQDEKEEDTTDESYEDSSRILLVYFFCDKTPEHGSAEGLVKSLIHQLVLKQPLVAVHTKFILKKKGREAQPPLTIDNLWQVLQDILADNVFVGARIYFVVNNLEALSPEAKSTATLLNLLSSEFESKGTERRALVRWLITSGQSWEIDQALKKPSVRLVDLEDDKYGDQVQLELRKHAQDKVLDLIRHKNYSRALAYFTSSVIGKRAQNTQWIDITCDQLEELPQHENDLQVRRLLEVIPQELTELLNTAWHQIFQMNYAKASEIKEMLRVLVLTYQDPTEAELGLLAGLDSTPEQVTELHGLVQSCRPLLVFKVNAESETTVCFTHNVVKEHLVDNAQKLLGLTNEDIKLQHGILGFRSFSHILEMFEVIPAEASKNAANDDDKDDENDGEEEAHEISSHDDDNSAETEDSSDDDEEDEEEQEEEDDDDESEDEEEEDEDPEAPYLKGIALTYAVQHWLHHASQATADIAEALSLEDEFWKKDSVLRRRWLTEYNRLTDEFENYERSEMTGLHVAAAIGFRQLVSALMDNGHAPEMDVRDSLVNTPLHLAAAFGKADIVDELLERGASIDDGIEINEMTPLHMAALDGHVKVMDKLLQRGANPNAYCTTWAGVINTAIESGNCDAVKLLVSNNVSLVSQEPDKDDDVEEEDEDEEDDEEEDKEEDEEDNPIKSPLALAAIRTDLTVFEFLVKEYSDKLPPAEFDTALVEAASWGRLEAFTRLLKGFKHTQKALQDAMECASWNGYWDIVGLVLENSPHLNCDNTFLYTAQGSDGSEEIQALETMWEYTKGGISPAMLDDSLYQATDYENSKTVELLLRFGASADATGTDYGNALTAAAFDGTMDIVTMLLDAGADVNSADGFALQYAAQQGHTDVVNLLLERGANVNALSTHENMGQGTALQAAVEAGKMDIVDILLQHGADPNLGAGEFDYPIIAAASKGEEAIFEALIRAKADVNAVGGEYESTPLIYAALYLPQSSLRLLLDAGADINYVANDGDTALIVTAMNGDADSTRFLLDRGADVLLKNHSSQNALEMAIDRSNYECVAILVEHVSAIMEAIRAAMASGDAAVTAVVRSVQNQKQELNYDDSEMRADAQSHNEYAEGEDPVQSERLAKDQGEAEFLAEKIVVENQEHDGNLDEAKDGSPAVTEPSYTSPSGPSAIPVQDVLQSTPDPLFKQQSQTSPTPVGVGVQPQGAPIRRKPISGPGLPLYKPYQPQAGSSSVRHSMPPEVLVNPYQAYQPEQQQASQHDSHSLAPQQETYTPPGHSSPEPGFVPYSPPATAGYGQANQASGRKASRSSFMGMKVPWSGDRFN